MASGIEKKRDIEERHEQLDAMDHTNAKHGDLDMAKQGAEDEHKMTLIEAIRLHPYAIMWSVLLSTCIIMEVT